MDPVSAFFLFLAKKLGAALGWFKVLFKSDSGEIRVASHDALIKLSKNASAGNININNFNLVLGFDKQAPGYSTERKDEILKETEKLISSHSAILSIDKGVQVSKTTKITETQKNQLQLFRKMRWSPDKINSLSLAFKIVNQEDLGSYDKAKELMESAFNGRKRDMNRKFYNLTRAGYINGFAMDIIFGGGFRDDESISNILTYFPPAIFIDETFTMAELNDELIKRERSNVSHVNIYARGIRRIEIMEEGYGEYLKEKVSQSKKTENKRVNLYMIKSKNVYKIAQTDSESIELELVNNLELQEYGPFSEMLPLSKKQKTF